MMALATMTVMPGFDLDQHQLTVAVTTYAAPGPIASVLFSAGAAAAVRDWSSRLTNEGKKGPALPCGEVV